MNVIGDRVLMRVMMVKGDRKEEPSANRIGVLLTDNRPLPLSTMGRHDEKGDADSHSHTSNQPLPELAMGPLPPENKSVT